MLELNIAPAAGGKGGSVFWKVGPKMSIFSHLCFEVFIFLPPSSGSCQPLFPVRGEGLQVQLKERRRERKRREEEGGRRKGRMMGKRGREEDGTAKLV